MPFRSDIERRAFYARCGKFSLSPDFGGLNRRINKEMFDGVKHRLKEKSLRDFVKEPMPEMNAGSFRGRITTLFDKKDSYFSKNKFSDGTSIHVGIDPVKYTTGVVIEEAIRNYEMNQFYYDKYGISKSDIIEIELAKNNLLGNET